MPFTPGEVEFFRGDVEKVVRFYDAAHGPAPWRVNIATIDGANVNKLRWTFHEVKADPEQAGWMRGKLKFDPAGLTSPAEEDRWLQTKWPPAGSTAVASIAMTVGCNYQPRQLTIKLRG